MGSKDDMSTLLSSPSSALVYLAGAARPFRLLASRAPAAEMRARSRLVMLLMISRPYRNRREPPIDCCDLVSVARPGSNQGAARKKARPPRDSAADRRST